MYISIQNLQRVLDEQGKTASDLRRLSFSPATIAHIRRGADVSTRTGKKLARVLGVPLERLLENTAGVVLDRVKLTVRMAAQGLTERQLIGLSGVNPFDAVAISNNRAISPGTAWRLSDALGVLLEDIL